MRLLLENRGEGAAYQRIVECQSDSEKLTDWPDVGSDRLSTGDVTSFVMNPDSVR